MGPRSNERYLSLFGVTCISFLGGGVFDLTPFAMCGGLLLELVARNGVDTELLSSDWLMGGCGEPQAVEREHLRVDRFPTLC